MKRLLVVLLAAVTLLATASLAASDPINEVAPLSACPAKGSQLFCAHNYVRHLYAIARLHKNALLYTAAKLKAQRMVACGQFTHTPCGDSFTLVFQQAGYAYRTAGENAALGYTGVRAVMAAWLASAGHRANILNATFCDYGANSAFKLNGQRLWVVDFGCQA